MSYSSTIASVIWSVNNGQTKLTPYMLAMDGLSGAKNKQFLNGIIEAIPNPVYLEIGVLTGTSFSCALFQNTYERAYAVDYWKEFDPSLTTHRQEFLDKLTQFNLHDVQLIEKDSFAIDPVAEGIHDVNVYYYDGHHSAESTYKSLMNYLPAMADEFIYIVDDFSFPGDANRHCLEVERGAMQAITELKAANKIKLEYSVVCMSERNAHKEGWWCGMFAAHIKKVK